VAGFVKLEGVIREAPVSYSARSKKDGKKIKLFLDPLIWVFSFWKYALRSPKEFIVEASVKNGGVLE
jgi:hypothetical protein